MATKKAKAVRMNKDDKSLVRTVGRENAKIRKGWAEMLGSTMKHDEQISKLIENQKKLDGKMKRILKDPIFAEPMGFKNDLERMKEQLKELKGELSKRVHMSIFDPSMAKLKEEVDTLEGKVEDHATQLEALTTEVNEIQEGITAPAPSPDNAPKVTPIERPSRQVDLTEAVDAAKAANPSGTGTDFERSTSYTEKPVDPIQPYVNKEKPQ